MTHVPTRTHRVAVLAGVLVLSACDIGAPLVDELPPSSGGIAGLGCREPPACEPTPRGQDLGAVELTAEREDLTGCRVEAPTACVPSASDDDAGVPNGFPPMIDCPRQQDVSPLERDLLCEEVHLNVDAPLSLVDVMWSRVNVELVAEAPVIVELTNATLRDVYVSLRGPVQLRLVRSHIANVAIESSLNGHGPMRPRLELVASAIEELAVANSAAPFQGEVWIEDSIVERTAVRSDELSLASTRLRESVVDVSDLAMTDVEVTNSSLRAGSALVSAYLIGWTEMSFCSGARLVSGSVTESNLGGCDDAVFQIFESSIGSSAVDGRVEADFTTFEGIRFGLEKRTELVLWRSGVSAVMLCEHVSHMAIGERTRVKCSECSAAFEEAEPLCVVPQAESEFTSNFCPILSSDPDPAECPEPLPVLARPVSRGR